MVFNIKNLSEESHTGVFLAKEIEVIIKQIGLKKFSAVVSDAGANIQNARKIISEKYPNIFNVRCIAHSINLISKDICNIPFANKILTRCTALKKESKNYNLQADYTNILPQAVLTILRSRAFFDDICALTFALHPIKKAILKLESQSCIFADYFIGLVQLGAAIKKLPENDYFTFCYQCYKEICWTRGTFQNLLITADEIFEKIGKSKSARKELMHQMKKYRTHQVPFDIELEDTEFPTIWLGVNKVENIYKLSAYYHAHAKQELPYYNIGKSNEKVHNIIVDTYLNLDDDLIETMEEEYVDSNTGILDESNELILSNVLNLNAEIFINSLDEIIEDSKNNMEEEYIDIQDVDEIVENENDID
ncbi:hypothetical protein RclHR1_11850008 [Rhizophagus clarus]|uniref:DUF659 domain-containing protein n=1 Tax=Rhizophagus clarus TaxID=94130 RepID=A0A2Z6Q572_9GLOM|nr:hypothetical protein RclHR1_11850008 [Rhizophagus clarus]